MSCNNGNSCDPVCPSIDFKSFMVGVVSVIAAQVFTAGFVTVVFKLFGSH
jgi:hypothetical protein